MALNAVVATVYVLTGSFRGLLTFKGETLRRSYWIVSARTSTNLWLVGMIEYVVYLATVSGLLLLRFRPRPADKDPLGGVYKTSLFNPVVFCCVATLMVVRSAVAHVIQAFIIVLVLGTGSLVYRSRWWRSLIAVPSSVDSD